MSEEQGGQAGAGGEGGGAGGGDERAWLSSIPENLRSHEAFKEVKTLPEVYQRFTDMTVKSKDMLAIPGDKATEEERAAFFGKLGRPESADKYTFTRPADLPEAIPYDDNVAAVYKQKFFELGISDKAASELTKMHLDLAKQGYEIQRKQEAEATEKAVNALKDEWKGDAFKENSELATRAFKKFGGEEAAKFIEETKINGLALGDHPMFLKIFSAVGKSISDDSFNAGRDGNNQQGQSDEDKAKARFPATYK